jgi:predicted lipoprotein with Yx(FWY)xxD motif
MTRSRTIARLAGAVAVALTALSVAACGGGGGATAATPSKRTTTASATISLADSSLGKILVDSRGRSLYVFKADAGTKSACTGACATAWPPLLTHGKATSGGASASLFGTAARPDGGRQVTYNRHPLYLFANDQKPGDVNGQGVVAFGAAWFVLSAAGNEISGRPAGGSGGLATRARHQQVEEHDVGMEDTRARKRLLGRAGLPHHADVRLALQAAADPRPQELVVVADEDADHGPAAGCSVTRVPPLGRGASSRAPP